MSGTVQTTQAYPIEDTDARFFPCVFVIHFVMFEFFFSMCLIREKGARQAISKGEKSGERNAWEI